MKIGESIEINYIDLSNDTSIPQSQRKTFIDILVGGKSVIRNSDLEDQYKEMYEKKIDGHITSNGLYNEYKNIKFKEQLGEYEESKSGIAIKKRIITYSIQ